MPTVGHSQSVSASESSANHVKRKVDYTIPCSGPVACLSNRYNRFGDTPPSCVKGKTFPTTIRTKVYSAFIGPYLCATCQQRQRTEPHLNICKVYASNSSVPRIFPASSAPCLVCVCGTCLPDDRRDLLKCLTPRRAFLSRQNYVNR